MQISPKTQIENYKSYVPELLNELKPQLIFVVMLLVAGVVFGLTNLFNSNEYINKIVNQLMANFMEFRGIELFFRILFNNLMAAAIVIYAGIFFSIFPTFSTIINGMIIGFILQKYDSIEGTSIYQGILYLIPHGIFEIPALILAVALGIKLGCWPFDKNKLQSIKINFNKSTICYIKIILPLLLIAAVIETIGIEIIYSFSLR